MADISDDGTTMMLVHPLPNGLAFVVPKGTGILLAPEASAVTPMPDGGICVLEGGNQQIFQHREDGAIRFSRDGAALVVINEHQNIGITADGRTGQTDNKLFARIGAYNPLARAMQFFSGDQKNNFIPNSSEAIARVGEAMKTIGIRCTDRKGDSSVPTITPKDASNLVDGVLSGRSF